MSSIQSHYHTHFHLQAKDVRNGWGQLKPIASSSPTTSIFQVLSPPTFHFKKISCNSLSGDKAAFTHMHWMGMKSSLNWGTREVIDQLLCGLSFSLVFLIKQLLEEISKNSQWRSASHHSLVKSLRRGRRHKGFYHHHSKHGHKCQCQFPLLNATIRVHLSWQF